MSWVLVALAPLALLVLYAIGIQYERGGAWRILAPVVWVGLVMDVLLNFAHFAVLFWDWPRGGEWTLSKRLPRLNRDTGWRGGIARRLTVLLDALAPSGVHVRN